MAKRELLAGAALAPEGGGVPTDPPFLGLGGEVDGDKSRMLSHWKVTKTQDVQKIGRAKLRRDNVPTNMVPKILEKGPPQKLKKLVKNRERSCAGK